MNDRKLRKILKENAINSRVTPPGASSRRHLRRLTQVAACLLVVCLLGVGYVAMVRFVGLPGDPQDTSPEVGAVGNSGTGDTTPPANGVSDILTASEDDDTSSPAGTGYDTFETDISATTVPEGLVVTPSMSLNVYAVDTTERLEWGGESITGDAVKDMVVERRYKLAEALGCEVTVNYYATSALLTETVTRDVAAGMVEYGLVTAPADSIMQLTTAGVLNDLAQMQSIDLAGDREYWNSCMADRLMIGSALYFVSGRISMGTMLSVGVLTADTAQLSLTADELYSTVLDGKWTLDRMLTLAKSAGGVGLSLDGDDGLQQLVSGAGLRLVTSKLDISEAWSDGSLEALILSVNGLGDKLSTEASGGALFTVTTTGDCAKLPSSTVILPLPAADEAQAAQGYCAPVGQGAVYYAIPYQREADTMAEVLGKLVIGLPFDDSCIVRRCASGGEASQTVLELIMDSMSVELDSVISQAEQPLLRGLAGMGGSSSAMLKTLCKINDKTLTSYRQKVG